MILGTVGYMSPEQAQGMTQQIDQRSDIFSFGCILFEAVTGQRAFEGKDAIDSLKQNHSRTRAADRRTPILAHLPTCNALCVAVSPKILMSVIKPSRTWRSS